MRWATSRGRAKSNQPTNGLGQLARWLGRGGWHIAFAVRSTHVGGRDRDRSAVCPHVPELRRITSCKSLSWAADEHRRSGQHDGEKNCAEWIRLHPLELMQAGFVQQDDEPIDPANVALASRYREQG